MGSSSRVGSGRPLTRPEERERAALRRVRQGPDCRTPIEDQAIAVEMLRSLRGWLPRGNAITRTRQTAAIVAAYCERYPAAGIAIWIEIAQRPEMKRLKHPARWLYRQLDGYGALGWAPETRAGRACAWVSAVLAGNRDEALSRLEAAHARAEVRSPPAPALPFQPAPRAATPPAPAAPVSPVEPEDPAATRAWLEGVLAAGNLDAAARGQAEAWLAELQGVTQEEA